MLKNKETIGVGITTCNRKEFFLDCINSLDLSLIDHVVVVNDGKPYENFNLDNKIIYIQNEKNLGVSKSKNIIFKELLKLNVDHIFTLEDDCIIVDNTVFNKYIEASQKTGLKHFNFGPGSPWNRKQDQGLIGDLSKRHLASQETEPNPKLIVKYDEETSIALYEHVVAMFCYFHKDILNKVGLMDEDFYNAWEHVEHTFRIIQEGLYTPFWWFADILGSEKYIKEAKNEKAHSSLAKNEESFMQQVQDGLKIFQAKHNTVPGKIPGNYTHAQIKEMLKQIYVQK